MLVYEMKPICYNMYKWGVQTDVGGNNRKEPNCVLTIPDYIPHRAAQEMHDR